MGVRTALRRLPIINGYTSLWLKDESQNPTGTFKDRLVERAIEMAEPNTIISTISYGNTALSLAHHLDSVTARQKNLSGCALIPADMRNWQLGPTTTGRTLLGSDLRGYLESKMPLIDLPIDGKKLTSDEITLLVKQRLSNGDVLDITEGLTIPVYREIAEEAVRQLGSTPDICIAPFGAGILCNEFKDYFKGSDCVVVPLSVSRRDSIAKMLFGPYWLNVELLRKEGKASSRHSSPDKTGMVREAYDVYDTSESEVRFGLDQANASGIVAEPSGTCGIGVLRRLSSIEPTVQPTSRILIINTGNGIDPLLDRLGNS